MSKRRRSSRDHHGDPDVKSTTHEVVGKHDDEYKSLFHAFISSDVVFEQLPAIQIIELIKVFASTKNIDKTFFELEMKTRSIASMLLLVSQVESSRVTKHESSTWSLSRVERVLSKHNVIPSKKNLVGLKQRGDELDKLKAKFKLLISVLLIVFTLRTNIFWQALGTHHHHHHHHHRG